MRRLAKCPPFRKRVVWLVGLFLVLGLSPGRSVRAEERFVPLGLGPGSAYEFRASLPRSTGSIELILAATSNGSAPDAEARPMCVLANASDEQTRLAVLVRSDRKALGLSNGRSLDWVPIRLDDGLLHHVILIAIGERTEVFLDTKYQGCFRVGFGEDQELPWTLGAFPGDRDPFRGKVATVRLWDRPLRGNDFPALETYGMPDLALAGLRDLTACSFFTNRGQEVVSYRGNIRRATVVGSVTTETGPQLIPTGARLQALRVHSREVPDPASPPPANTNTSNNTPARKLSQILDVEPVFQFTRFDRQPIPGAPSYTPRTWAIVQFREEQERLLQMLARAARWRHTRLMDLFATEPFQNFGPSWVDYLHLAAVDEALKPFEKGTPARDEIHTLEKAIVPLTPDLVRPGLSETQKAILVSEPVVRLYEALETLLESRLVPPNDPPESAEPRAAARLSWKRSQVETLAQCARRNLEQVALWFEASEIKNPWNRGDTFHAIERLIATFTDPLANAATRQAALDAAADPRAALANLGEENAKDADDAPLPRQRLAALRNWLDRLESATEPNRQTNATPGQPATSTPITIPFKQDPNDAGKDEAIAMIAGTRGPVLSTLRLITNARMLEVIGNHPAREPFSTKVPLSGRFAGFINTYSDEGLSSLQPLFDDPPPDAPAPAWAENHVLLPPRIDLGRFHPEGVRKPTRNDKLITDLAGPLNDPESATKSGNAAADPRQFRLARNLFDPSTGRVQPHANYTTFPVANLWFTVTGEPIVAIDDLDRPADRQVTLFRFSPVPGDRSRFTGETDDHRRLELSLLENGDFVLTGLDARYPTSAVRYVRPLLSAEAGPNGDKLPWGATFSSDHRPVLSEFNVRGYHVPRLDARNYQLGTGTSHNVFEWPDDESTDYQTTAAGKIIPRGLFYRNDREGNGSVRTTVSMTSQEHQEAWSCNLGLSGGYGGMAAFSLDTSYQSESATMQEQETGSTLAMTHEVKHALVLDRSTMRLDPTFTERVERLRDLYLAGIADDALNAECARLVDDFGTNYPYAVCYGGTAYQEKKYESSRLSRMQGSGFSVQAKLETEFLAARAGVSGGYSQNSKDTTGTAARNEADSIITIGGEIAHGGGWSVPDRSEVPVLLDLRPLTELLSPLYFDDKIVWTELRTRIGNILEFMADEASTSYTVPPPHMVRVRLTELVQVENERGGSLAVDVLTGNPALDALIAATRKGERPQVQLDLIQQLVAAGAYFRVNQPSILVSGAPSASGGKDKWSGARVLKTNDNSFKVWGPPIGLTGAAYEADSLSARRAKRRFGITGN
ncbi:MAG: MAC/perforin domain-containing protein [Isosphaeraceae bacterium]